MEQKQVEKFGNGTMTRTTWQCEGIRLGHAVSKTPDYTQFSAGNKDDVVRMHFGLRGNYSFFYKQLNQTYDLIGSHHNIMYSQGFDMVVQNKTLEIETFGVQFSKELFISFTQNASDLLKRFADNILNGKSVLLSPHWAAIDSNLQQVILQIIHCQYGEDLIKLFLLSKSIELLVLSADAYDEAASRTEIFIKNPTDKEKIIAVRDLINARVHCPPNLTEIARTVGLNEYKLKRGFKETFNNTVFGYLTEQRLQLAHRYLLDTRKTAAEISFELGYSTPQHFNTAFKKKFGQTPQNVRGVAPGRAR
jgi:AraC-like DNA-binding protein